MTLREQIEANIKANGWAGIGVGGTEDQPSIPFLYTVGLRDRGLPELLMVGAISKAIIDQTLLALDAGAPDDGFELTLHVDLTDAEGIQHAGKTNVVLRTLPAEAAATYTRFAAQYYGEPVSCMQIVFPDATGLYPWQPGCDHESVAVQSAVVDWRTEIRH